MSNSENQDNSCNTAENISNSEESKVTDVTETTISEITSSDNSSSDKADTTDDFLKEDNYNRDSDNKDVLQTNVFNDAPIEFDKTDSAVKTAESDAQPTAINNETVESKSVKNSTAEEIDGEVKTNPKPRKKIKVGTIVADILIVLLIALALYIVIGSVTAKKNGKAFFFFGLSAQLVVTDSMTPTINEKDLVFVKQAEITDVNAAYDTGDIIMFKSLGGTLAGQNIMHRAVSSGYDSNGNMYLKTLGDKVGAPLDQNNGQPNVTAANFEGIYLGKSAFLGKVVAFFKNWLNWVFLVLIIIAVIVAVKAIKKLVSIKKEEQKGKENKV